MIVDKIKSAVALYAHLPRYRQIFHIFFKYGFGDALKSIHLERFIEVKIHSSEEQRKLLHLAPEVRFRMALEELGPTFVKLGQILSSRRDLVSEKLHKELCKLQDQVPSFSSTEAVAIVEKELGKSVHHLFKKFEKKPMAAASIAQVHRAVLKNGTIVAIKIQRPDIPKQIEIDLEILEDLAGLLEKKINQLAVIDPLGLVKEFGRTLRNELDFTFEARNMDRFGKQFRGNHSIRIPHVYHEFSTQKVLVMQFIKGCDIDDPEKLRAHHINPVKLSQNISKLIYQQIFTLGFFHGDPHPGNMTILPRGIMCLYDYGMMGNLTLNFREQIASMVLGITEKDHRKVMRALLGMSKTGYADRPGDLESDIANLSNRYLEGPLKEIRLGTIFNRLLDVLMEHRIHMKPTFYLGIKALSQIEDIAQGLNPDLYFIKVGEPYARSVLEDQYSLKTITHHVVKSGMTFVEILKDFPTELQDLYNKVRHEKYSIPIEHRINAEGFEPLRNTMNHIANRLSNTILTASLLICSGLFVLADIPPKWFGMPVIGVLGLILGVIMMLRIFQAIRKRGGL